MFLALFQLGFFMYVKHLRGKGGKINPHLKIHKNHWIDIKLGINVEYYVI